VLADNSAGGPGALVGPPSVDIDEKQNVRLLYDSNGAPRVVEGSDLGLSGTLTLGPGFAGSQTSVSVMNPAGGGVSAWPTAQAGAPAVAVREDFAGGAVQTGFVRGGGGGPIGELGVGRSGLGDGLVGFLQGPVGNAAIAAAEVSAPPTQLLVEAPKGWLLPSRATVTWPPAASADGPLTYTVVLDGHPLATPAGVSAMSLDRHRLGSGRHLVALLATDITGGASLSAPVPLLIDATPPTVAFSVSSRRGLVRVRVSDAFSGVARRAVSVRFGDGSRARGRTRFTHRYARAGVYEVSVFARSRAGNAGVVRRLVSVR
jgi:hypothetical protein